MKKSLFSVLLSLSLCFAMAQTKHVITNVGNIYTPDSILVEIGDTVEFDVGAAHPTLEVDQSTWAANGTTPLSGGFDYPSGQGSFVVTTQKTYYYICTAHAAIGMKGRIFVKEPVGIDENIQVQIEIFPNPVREVLSLNSGDFSEVEIARILDLSGKVVKTIRIGENDAVQKIDISVLKSGHYLLQLQGGKGSQQLRFVKE